MRSMASRSCVQGADLARHGWPGPGQGPSNGRPAPVRSAFPRCDPLTSLGFQPSVPVFTRMASRVHESTTLAAVDQHVVARPATA